MLASAAAQRIGSLLLDDALESPAPRERTRSLLAFLFAIFVVFSLHASLGTGSLSTPVIRAAGSLQPVHGDSKMQFKSKFVAMASAVALSVGGSALGADLLVRVGEPRLPRPQEDRRLLAAAVGLAVETRC